MKIENIKVNSFGKLKNKEINLSEGINIIYGNNESGKSTLLKFIQNIFYGTSKNKKGKMFSDYDLYKPWEGEDFSGKITYKLDSGEKYNVYREFSKKNPKIYNEQLEDITKNFNIDKNTGSEFFYEQTKVDEFMFLSSVVSMQQEVKLNVTDQNVFIQKIANLASTGDDNISFKKAIDKLNKKQLEEIGTERSQGKPINIVKQQIIECKTKLQELEKINNNKFELEKRKKELLDKIETLKIENAFLKELNEIKNIEKLELEKVNINENIKQKNNSQILEIEKELQNKEEKEKNSIKEIKNVKALNTKLYIILVLIIIMFGSILYLITKSWFAIAFAITILTGTILTYIYEKNKYNQQKKSNKIKRQKINAEISEQIKIMQNKIDILKKNNDEIDSEIKKILNKVDLELGLKKENLKSKYINKINLSKINELLDSDNLINILNVNEEKIKEEYIKINLIDLEKKQTLEELEEMVNIVEKLENFQKEYNELTEKNDKINKAKEYIQIAYEKMKNNITPKFTANLSNIMQKISNEKYKRIYINDSEGMLVELPNGEYVSAEKLSTGTIEQLYLALRLSMVKEISEETMPIILDEAFAYYDDVRLENVLKFIKENFAENQIIIFTCTHREEKMLDKLNYSYTSVIVQ